MGTPNPAPMPPLDTPPRSVFTIGVADLGDRWASLKALGVKLLNGPVVGPPDRFRAVFAHIEFF